MSGTALRMRSSSGRARGVCAWRRGRSLESYREMDRWKENHDYVGLLGIRQTTILLLVRGSDSKKETYVILNEPYQFILLML